MIKSYLWWTGDPWAALLTLAAMIVVLSVVGILVVHFTYEKFIKSIAQNRPQIDAMENPNYGKPPYVLREYETQSLNVYMPADDAVSDLYGFSIPCDECGIQHIPCKGHGANS